jgi:hypothetical protein
MLGRFGTNPTRSAHFVAGRVRAEVSAFGHQKVAFMPIGPI